MFKKMFAGEVGKLGVNLDLLLDKKNLLLFHGLDLVKTSVTFFQYENKLFPSGEDKARESRES